MRDPPGKKPSRITHGINGRVEHIFTITSILDNAIQKGLPPAITFLDLESRMLSAPWPTP